MTNVIRSETNGIASEITLLPCPWCGKSDKLKMHPRKTRHYDKPLQSVMCARCGTRGRYQLTEDRAVTAWNTRPLDAASIEMAQRIQSLELECEKLAEGLRKAGVSVDVDDALAILDEIHYEDRISYDDYSRLFDSIAALGVGECEITKEFVDLDGERMTDYTCCLNQSGWGHNYCPNCGRKVKQ